MAGIGPAGQGNHVTLAIKGPDGQPVNRADGSGPVAPVRTMDGRYRFENVPLLENRRYYVDVVWSQSPGLVGMRPADGSADWYAVEVPSTWQNPDPLAGWTPNVPTPRFVDRPAVEQRVSITGVAFEDRNRDGVRPDLGQSA